MANANPHPNTHKNNYFNPGAFADHNELSDALAHVDAHANSYDLANPDAHNNTNPRPFPNAQTIPNANSFSDTLAYLDPNPDSQANVLLHIRFKTCFYTHPDSLVNPNPYTFSLSLANPDTDPDSHIHKHGPFTDPNLLTDAQTFPNPDPNPNPLANMDAYEHTVPQDANTFHHSHTNNYSLAYSHPRHPHTDPDSLAYGCTGHADAFFHTLGDFSGKHPLTHQYSTWQIYSILIRLSMPSTQAAILYPTYLPDRI
jgi:hypothetical protein